jgi:hypothetical protein
VCVCVIVLAFDITDVHTNSSSFTFCEKNYLSLLCFGYYLTDCHDLDINKVCIPVCMCVYIYIYIYNILNSICA